MKADSIEHSDARAGKRSAATRTSHVRLAWLLVLPIALVAFLLADAAADLPNFNPDESRWISRAHYLADLRDPLGPTWADQYMTRGQPPLGSYAMGAGLLLQGRDLETNPPWDFAIPWEENIASGHKPAPEDLAAGRRTSAALVALTAIAIVAIARVFVSLPWALLAGSLFAIHPFSIYIGSIAMADALFGLLIGLAALAGAAYAKNPGWPRAALLGVLLGLGGATKLSPLAVAIGITALLLAGAAYAAFPRRDWRQASRRAIYGLTIIFAAALTFVAVYPFLWPDPIGRTGQLFAFRVEEMAAQSSDWPVMAVPNRAEALRRVGINFTERFNLAGSALSLAGYSTPLPLRAIEIVVALLGIAAMTVAAIRAGPFSSRIAVLAVLGGQAAVTILGMRSEFDRYHLPMALLGIVGAAVGLEWLTRAVCQHWPWQRPHRAAKGGGEVIHVGRDEERLAGAHQSE